jgi:hypothetical protein
MRREELEHIIRASGDITNQYEFVIVGSQSMLGPVPNPEEVFTASMEADIYPLQAPELADEIDGAIGEGSQFHRSFGYYAQGVGPETATLPKDWMQRVHRVQSSNTNGRVGYFIPKALRFEKLGDLTDAQRRDAQRWTNLSRCRPMAELASVISLSVVIFHFAA